MSKKNRVAAKKLVFEKNIVAVKKLLIATKFEKAQPVGPAMWTLGGHWTGADVGDWIGDWLTGHDLLWWARTSGHN